jgi:DNA-binding CsgD family transcriptional regulator
MNRKERTVIIVILSIVAVMVVFDLFTDSKEGVVIWHVLVEGGAGLAALFGIFYFMKDSFHLKHRLSDSQNENIQLQKQASAWKNEAQKYIEGLSLSIDQQLTKWNLSVAEKEVALLLLKGLSLKEIAEVRSTTEKTSRVQSISVYSKSGLSGRSELAAFFLEDLLQPQKLTKNSEIDSIK